MRYDLIVIGSGPGGYEAASLAGRMGKQVLLIEKEELGGVCANKGCIPTKSLLHGAKLYHAAKQGGTCGVDASPSYDLEKAKAWKDDAIGTLRGSIAFLEKKSGVTVLQAEAVAKDAHHVEPGGLECGKLLIATGSRPARLPISGIEGNKHVVTSDDIFSLPSIPSSIVIIGGGVIGVEFASYFSLLGCKVEVIEMMDEILPMMEGEMSKLMRRSMQPVSFHLGCKVSSIDGGTVHFSDKQGKEGVADGSLVLLATGRVPSLSGVEDLHLEMSGRAIKVDQSMRTSAEDVYAIGDVNGLSMLAHSASRMAEVAVSSMFGDGSVRFDADKVPWAVYGYPEASGCGLTEAKAKEKGYEVRCATSFMRSNGRFLAEEGKRAPGMVKIVMDQATRKVLGIHILGSYASELIWGASMAVGGEMTVDALASTLFPHPSVSETIRECALQL